MNDSTIPTKIIFCHWDLLRFLEQKHMVNDNGEDMTLSVTAAGDMECKLFLKKHDTGYDVTVIKCEENGNYTPHEDDNVDSYEENNEQAVFHFKDFDKARSFLDNLGYFHKEYAVRPMEKLDIKRNPDKG